MLFKNCIVIKRLWGKLIYIAYFCEEVSIHSGRWRPGTVAWQSPEYMQTQHRKITCIGERHEHEWVNHAHAVIRFEPSTSQPYYTKHRDCLSDQINSYLILSVHEWASQKWYEPHYIINGDTYIGQVPHNNAFVQTPLSWLIWLYDQHK